MSESNDTNDDSGITRREFLQGMGAGAAGTYVAMSNPLGLWSFDPAENIDNPLDHYPNRDWEQVYRDQYKYDRSFEWVCAPNDTHMCRVRSYVRNGVMIRSEQNYDVQDYGDLYGNEASAHWNPRMCPKGFTFHRRVYGPHRLKGPVLRKGWKEWADDGFPSLSDNPELRSKYRFDDRANDEYVRLSWNEVSEYAAKGLKTISETYSGDEGRRRLMKDGYDEEMLQDWNGAGTRTMKMGSNLPIHGVVGKFGLFRFGNLMSLLDHHVRGVDPDEAQGIREWTEYTWRGDQAPGQPFVHGLQTSDCDFNDLRETKLHIQVGKNLVENKMPESHWFIEMMERGGKIVSIAPEYNAPATKADYWIGVRAGLSDTSIFLYTAKYLIDNDLYDADFVKKFTDFPLLMRKDNLERLQPSDIIEGYEPPSLEGGPSMERHGLTEEQREQVGDFMVFDQNSGELKPVTREHVGEELTADGIDPSLSWEGTVRTTSGETVEVMTVFDGYKIHLRDYDLDTVSEISHGDKEKIKQLAEDLATIQPAAIHHGEGINHYFHATEHNRAVHLPMMLTGNIGKPGAGVYTWAGNYKGAIMQGSPWSGKGAGCYVAEDPFNQQLDPEGEVHKEHVRKTMKGEEVSYWGNGEEPLKVDTPEGEKMFTGDTHMPCPTKLMWYNNANLINQAKWSYQLTENVNPKIDMIVDQQIEWTGSAQNADFVLPVNSWVEFENLEMGASCSNPFFQFWGGDDYEELDGIDPLYDSVDDAEVFANVSDKLAEITDDERFSDHFKFVKDGNTEVYIDRMLRQSCTASNKEGEAYTCEDVMNGEYGHPGAVIRLDRTTPRVPFHEQIHDSVPFYTDTGRLNSYCDIPEAIEYGENFIVHREGVEATPYLPNVIVSSNPYIRPEDYGIPEHAMDADLRQVRNIKKPWEEVKETTNPLWEEGFRLFCSTPKSRHSVHSSWSVVDWNWIWSDNFGDPYRDDERQPGVADRQIQVHPETAKQRGIEDGDYVFVDANPTDRPFEGWQDELEKYEAFRCKVRVKYNEGLPKNFTIMKHTGWMATEKTVKAHRNREDGKAIDPDTGYQASYRTGSHQSVTRSWMMPMHQTDNLFHKTTISMGFTFGFALDNHAVNTVPKETLVNVEKAEDGGMGGEGVWKPATTGYTPGNTDDRGEDYLLGNLTTVKE